MENNDKIISEYPEQEVPSVEAAEPVEVVSADNAAAEPTVSEQPTYTQPTYSQPSYGTQQEYNTVPTVNAAPDTAAQNAQPQYQQPVVYAQPIPQYQQPTYTQQPGQPQYQQPAYTQPQPGQPVYQVPVYQTPGAPQGYSYKSKLTAGLLGIFLGGLGIHNFYLGKTGIAVLQLILTIITCYIASLWGFIEGILILCGNINTDGNGYPLTD